ncbi:hypothetical protein [Herbidospora sp. RD11066]
MEGTRDGKVRALLYDVCTVLLLTFGGLLLVVGWLVGAYMLLASKRWRPWEKALGLLVWPLGVLWVYVVPLMIFSCEAVLLDGRPYRTTCPGSTEWVTPTAMGAAFALEVLVMILLLLRPRRRG